MMGLDRLPSGNFRARLMVDGVKYSSTFAPDAEAEGWLVVERVGAVRTRAGYVVVHSRSTGRTWMRSSAR